MADIEELTQLVNRFRDDRDWRRHHKPKDLAVNLALEAAEVLELFHWKSDEEVRAYIESGGREAVADELADVLYTVLALSNDLGIELRAAFEQKLKKTGEKYPVDKSRGSKKKYTEL